MALNFPTSPTYGDLWPSPPVTGLPVWTWDGNEWVTGPLMVLVVSTPTYYIYGF
jgi:hypothetical protein